MVPKRKYFSNTPYRISAEGKEELTCLDLDRLVQVQACFHIHLLLSLAENTHACAHLEVTHTEERAFVLSTVKLTSDMMVGIRIKCFWGIPP